jgi:UDP-N-acetylmuramate dehydrogenase
LETEKLAEKLAGVLKPEQILLNEKMSARTTFRTGGTADIFVETDTAEELRNVLKVLKSMGISRLNRDFYLLGNGSNVLVSDSGIRGIVLHMSRKSASVRLSESDENTLICSAGATLALIARTAYENSLTGFEFAAGIPGSLGGAIVMNAGAYDGEMKQVVKSVRLMTTDGDIVTKSNDEMKFSYRHSILKEEDFIVLEAAIGLSKGQKAEIKEKMDDLAERRRDKQPLDYPSAGSTFKRPEGYFAAKLIDDAGLRGYSVGGARVSDKHCGFVINSGNATSSDIYTLIRKVQEKVKSSSGVSIEPEVILLGDFD